MVTIDSHFIGNFKDGDNICYNLTVLDILYATYREREPQIRSYLHKPMVVFNVSILEAALDDLFYKIKRYTREGVPNIPSELTTLVRSKPPFHYKFEKHIRLSERYDLLDANGSHLYTALHDLRKLRNRMHIQNNHRTPPPDERRAFSVEALIKSEKGCEYVLKKMSDKFPRSPFATNFVEDFILPWDSHLTQIEEGNAFPEQ